jgi:hypothetical protein
LGCGKSLLSDAATWRLAPCDTSLISEAGQGDDLTCDLTARRSGQLRVKPKRFYARHGDKNVLVVAIVNLCQNSLTTDDPLFISLKHEISSAKKTITSILTVILCSILVLRFLWLINYLPNGLLTVHTVPGWTQL